MTSPDILSELRWLEAEPNIRAYLIRIREPDMLRAVATIAGAADALERVKKLAAQWDEEAGGYGPQPTYLQRISAAIDGEKAP